MAGNVADLPASCNRSGLTLEPGTLDAPAFAPPDTLLEQAASLGGGPLSLALSLLMNRHFRFDAADPDWPDRDRLIVEPEFAGIAADLGAKLGMLAPISQAATHPVAVGAGAALAERMLAGRFGRSLVDHRAWVLSSGLDLASGPVQEAAWLAAAWRMGRLAVLTDVETEDAPGLAGFLAAGWTVRRVAAHDPNALGAAFSAAMRSQKPSLIATFGPAGLARATHDGHLPAWRQAAGRLAGARRGWLKRLARHAGKQDFEAAMAGRLPAGWRVGLAEPDRLLPAGTLSISTAEILRLGIAAIASVVPDLAVLACDPAWPSPPAQTEPPAATRPASGRLKTGMSGVLAGAALHGGVLPLASQSLAGVDTALPSLRTLARARRRLVQILVETAPACPQTGQRAALRAVRNLHVFRPGDAAEALECLELAMRRHDGPSVLLVCEQAVPLLSDKPVRTHAARGGYVVAEAAGRRLATLIASGPELSLAMRVRAALARARLPVAVVSLPCWELFAQQEAKLRAAILGEAPRIALEAGSGFGWERWLGPNGLFVAAAPGAEDLPACVAETIRRHLDGLGLI